MIDQYDIPAVTSVILSSLQKLLGNSSIVMSLVFVKSESPLTTSALRFSSALRAAVFCRTTYFTVSTTVVLEAVIPGGRIVVSLF